MSPLERALSDIKGLTNHYTSPNTIELSSCQVRFQICKIQNFQVFHSLENKFLVIEMDTTKAAEVMDCDTTGMRNAQLFLKIRLGDKIWEESGGNVAAPSPLMAVQVQEGKTNPDGNPGGNVANPESNITSGGNMATPSPLMAVQVPAPMPVPVMGVPPVAPKGDQEMLYFWVQSALGPQLFMVPMIRGQPLGYPRMVNASYPGPNLNPYLGSSYNPNIRANPGQSLGSSVNTSPDLSPELPRRTQNPTPLNPNANIFQPRQ